MKFGTNLEVTTLDPSVQNFRVTNCKSHDYRAEQIKRNFLQLKQHIVIEYKFVSIVWVSLKRFPGGMQASFVSFAAVEQGNK